MHSSERTGQVPGPQGDAGHQRKDSTAHWTRSESKSRPSVSSASSRKEAKEKHQELFRKWEEFKAIQREEKHALLEQKIALQRELIRAHDDLFLSRRSDTDRKLEELRKSDLQKKKDQEEALTQIGKDELGREKEEQLTKRAQERAAERKRQKDEKEKLEGGGEVGEGGGVPVVAGSRALSTVQSRAETGLSGGDLLFEPHDATGVLVEEGEDVIQEEVAFEDLPPHKQKLYTLLGEDEAEYFLHPRIEPERRKVIRMPHAVRQLGGRVGADALWDTLRDRSQHRLQYADARIPLELKDAYGAFVRECLTKNKTVAKRSFYSETEVPDNEKLQDSSYKERVKEAQRHMELMYRAALANEDKTGVLLYNNPMPDFNNWEGHEGPLRYLPSWIHVDDDEEEEEARETGYKKWLVSSSQLEMQPLPFDENLESFDIDMVQEANARRGEGDQPYDDDMDFGDDDPLAEGSISSQSLPDLMLADEDDFRRPDPRQHRQLSKTGGTAGAGGGDELAGPAARGEKKKKLVFLTEKDATCEGRFMENIAAKEAASSDTVTGEVVMEAAGVAADGAALGEGQLSARRGKKKLRSHTAPATVGGKPESEGARGGGGGDGATPRGGGGGGTRASRRTRSSTKGQGWEPLTMTALNDHKPAVTLLGGADFAQGREFMWKPILSTTSKGS